MKPIHVGRPIRLLLRLSVIGMTLAVLAPAGSGSIGASVKLPTAEGPSVSAINLVPYDIIPISGFLGTDYIQIDDLDNDPNSTPDANLTSAGEVDACPTIGSVVAGPNVNCPSDNASDFLDWNDLDGVLNEKFVVTDPSGNTDNSFAGTSTSSCLQPDHAAPQKEDILRIYLANNLEYFYFGEVDKAPQGDSRHIFILNKLPPKYDNSATCSGNGNQLYLALSPGDKLIKVIFAGSTATEPNSQLYRYVGDNVSDYMYADQAGDYLDQNLWEEVASTTGEDDAIANFAVNVDDVQDYLGYEGTMLPGRTFGEGAISLEELGITACGGSYYINVITRSSGSGSGESKDYVGIKYDFGSISVDASLTPSCEQEFGYAAQAYDQTEAPIDDADVNYNWTCIGPETLIFSGKSGNQTGVDPGQYTCTVTADATASIGCSTTSDEKTVDVYEPLSVAVDAVPTCTLGGQDNTYEAVVSGGSGNVTHAWTGTGVTFSDSAADSGTYSVGSDGTYTLVDDVTDNRNGLICSDSDSDFVELSVLSTTAMLSSTCNLTLPFSASVSGNLSAATFAWLLECHNSEGAVFVDPSSTDNQSGVALVTAPGGACSGNVTASDLRKDQGKNPIDDYTCKADDVDNAEVYGPIVLELGPNDTPLGCPLLATRPAGTAVTYSANVSGGKGPYTYTWTVESPGSSMDGCGLGDNTCEVDSPSENYCAMFDVDLEVEDSFDLCTPKSDSGTVTKETIVTAN